MKQKDIFTCKTPIEVELTAIVVSVVWSTENVVKYLCYSNNMLFYYIEEKEYCYDNNETYWRGFYNNTVISNVFIPEYDKLLEEYQHQLDKANNHSNKEV